MENPSVNTNPNNIKQLDQTVDKITGSYSQEQREHKKNLITQSYNQIKDRLAQSETFNLTPEREEVLNLKIARYFQNHEEIDAQVIGDAILETPKFIDNEKGSLDRLLQIHEQKTLQRIAEARKKRAELGDSSISNPYENLFTTKSGDYYMARLLNMPHLEAESAYMSHCVGTSDSYVNKIKKGEIEILSFRQVNGGAPIITIEYNLKTKEIVQMKKKSDGILSTEDPYFEDFIDALARLRNTETDKGEKREFVKIQESEMRNVHVGPKKILTNRGVFDVRKYQHKDGDFIFKSGPMYINEGSSRKYASDVFRFTHGMIVSYHDIALRPDQVTNKTRVYIGELPQNFFKNLPPNIESIYTRYPGHQISILRPKSIETDIQKLTQIATQKSINITKRGMLTLESIKPSHPNSSLSTYVVIRPDDMGLSEHKATVGEIYRKSKEYGLSLCNPEIALQLGLEADELGLSGHLTIAMDQLPGAYAEPSILEVSKTVYGGTSIDSIEARNSSEYLAYKSFVFQISTTQ